MANTRRSRCPSSWTAHASCSSRSSLLSGQSKGRSAQRHQTSTASCVGQGHRKTPQLLAEQLALVCLPTSCASLKPRHSYALPMSSNEKRLPGHDPRRDYLTACAKSIMRRCWRLRPLMSTPAERGQGRRRHKQRQGGRHTMVSADEGSTSPKSVREFLKVPAGPLSAIFSRDSQGASTGPYPMWARPGRKRAKTRQDSPLT